jgi:hypothetical protein
MRPSQRQRQKIIARTALEIFGGGRVCVENKPLFCPHCDADLLHEYHDQYQTAPVKELVALPKKRTTRIVERKWPDGRRNWGCHACGREVGKTGGRNETENRCRARTKAES